MEYKEHVVDMHLSYEETAAQILNEKQKSEGKYYPLIMKAYQLYIQSELSKKLYFQALFKYIADGVWCFAGEKNQISKDKFVTIFLRDYKVINREIMDHNKSVYIKPFFEEDHDIWFHFQLNKLN